MLPFRLERQPQAELHVPAAAIEQLVVQERARSRNENVAGIQRIGVGVLIERAVVRWQADAEIAVVKRVVGLQAELQGETLRQPGVLEYAHVPDVEPGRVDGVASGVGSRSGPRLDKPRRRIAQSPSSAYVTLSTRSPARLFTLIVFRVLLNTGVAFVNSRPFTFMTVRVSQLPTTFVTVG